jgi:hypothetical protein
MANAPSANQSKAVESRRPYELLIAELKELASLGGSNGNFDIASQVVDQIMAATTFDEIVEANASGPVGVKGSDYLGIPLSIYNVDYFKSDPKYSENSLGVFVVFDVFLDDGTMVKLSTGAPNIVSSFRVLQKKGLFSEEKPLRLVIKKRDTGNGELFTIGKPVA